MKKLFFIMTIAMLTAKTFAVPLQTEALCEGEITDSDGEKSTITVRLDVDARLWCEDNSNTTTRAAML